MMNNPQLTSFNLHFSFISPIFARKTRKRMKPKFLLFKASAGSGKTYNLAIEYIALLVAQGEQAFRHTLAVTFTNKATAEMKDRILEFLYDIWKHQPQSDGKLQAVKDVAKDLWGKTLSDDEIRERCGQALHAVLHDYSRFVVSTIDAFFQTVLRSMAHELGLSARLQVDLDDKNVIELAVENLIDSLRHDNKDVLPWLREYIEQQLAEGSSWDVRRKLKDMARMLFQEEYLKRSLSEQNRPFDIKNISDFKKDLIARKKALLKPLEEEARNFDEAVKLTGMGYKELFNNGRYVEGYVEKLGKGSYEDANFSATLQGFVDDAEKMLNSKLRKDESMRSLVAGFSSRLGLLRQIHASALSELKNTDLILANLTPMGLLGAIDKEVARLSAERNRFMLAHTPILLRKMVEGNDASFVFERAGTQYQNIMIDEFQDTSRLQWENFRTLLIDNLASGGLNMIVGDIKQSIYRWRNGDWRILHELGTQGYGKHRFTEKPLTENYRSLGNIVTFNNLFFPKAAEALDKMVDENCTQLQELYADVNQTITRDSNSGYVHIQLKRTKEKGDWESFMLEDLALQIESLIAQGMPLNEMTILVRKNKFIPTIVTFLAKRLPGVKTLSSEAFLLGSSVAVKMLVCALQVVDDPERDPVAMRYLAKHYLCNVQHKKTTESDALLPKVEEILPKEFIAHLNELRHIPLYELCEKLYRLLDIHQISGQDAYLFTFFDELANYLRDNPSDTPTFVQYWQENMQNIPIPNSEVDGIQLFSIHKSKGLAFHTVLMPYADWTMEKDNNMGDVNWCTPHREPYNALGSLPISFSSNKVKDTDFEDDYREEHANRRADELNALYVAFTRAKANLYVWGLSEQGLKDAKQNESVADLMYDVLEDELDENKIYTYGNEPVIAPKREREEKLEVNMQSYEGSFTFRQSGEAERFIGKMDDEEMDEETLGYIEQGKLLHYIFSKIETANDIDRVTDDFVRQGILKSEAQAGQVRRLAHNGLKSEQVQDWFSGRYQLFNECNILLPDPDNPRRLLKRRPDRVMMSSERIIVVDFKFGKPKEEYKTQVQQYVEIMQKMYPDLIVEGWLWYVYKNRVEAPLPPSP